MASDAVNLQMTIGGVAVVLLVGGAVWFGFGPDPQAPAVPETMAVTRAPSTLTVHVSGAVARPGVVVVADGARVADAVAAAGGATSPADLERLNLAAAVSDGDLITVPVRAPAGSVGGGPEPSGVDLNRSTAAQLEGLPGVGPVLAERIVAYRDEHGPFTEVEGLLDVPGIGEAKLDAMRDAISDP